MSTDELNRGSDGLVSPPAADHGPRAGCVASSCGLADPFNCPFYIPRREPDTPPAHTCEWRQYWTVPGIHTSMPSGFYCIHNPDHRRQ